MKHHYIWCLSPWRKEKVSIAKRFTTHTCTFCHKQWRERTPAMQPLSVDRIMEVGREVSAEEKRCLREGWEK